MAEKKPTTLEEFEVINGVGKIKLKKYGEIFVKEIKDYLQRHGGLNNNNNNNNSNSNNNSSKDNRSVPRPLQQQQRFPSLPTNSTSAPSSHLLQSSRFFSGNNPAARYLEYQSIKLSSFNQSIDLVH